MSDEKLTTIYTPNGKPLKVNEKMVELLKAGDKSLKGFSLTKPKQRLKCAFYECVSLNINQRGKVMCIFAPATAWLIVAKPVKPTKKAS